MIRVGQLQTLRSRLLAPLLILLTIFVLLFSYLAWNFLVNYSSLSAQVELHSHVGRNVMEIMRARAVTQEALLMYRLQAHPSVLAEIESEDKIRLGKAQEIEAMAAAQPTFQALSSSLVAGLIEISFLRDTMIEAIQRGDLNRADRAFQQLSLIFEINSARLKDFSLKNEHKVLQNESDLQDVLITAYWGFAFAIFLLIVTIWLIAVFYRTSVLAPMQKLHHGLQSLAAGNLKSRITAASAPLELFQMMHDFNNMASSLEASQEQVKSALKLRDEFLSIASHELKTPLTSLKLQAQINSRKISQGKDRMSDAQIKKFSDLIDSQVRRLNVLVEEMLDISRIQSGKLMLVKEPADLAQITKTVCEELSEDIKLTGSVLELNLRNVTGRWDKHRIEQVIINLVSNAAKYGNGKPIHVKVFSKGSSAFLSVRDQGIGIAKENYERIFERFERASAAPAIQGLGLGLYIVKQILAAHHGSIRVESEPGKGSTFIVELPLTD